MAQSKKQNYSLEIDLEEVGIYELVDKEFKIIILWKLNELL